MRQILRNTLRRAQLKIGQVLGLKPQIEIARSRNTLIELGTDYGGWIIATSSQALKGTAICCGAGEDISFDAALANRFGLQVVVVDPTPRSIAHVEAVLARTGEPAAEEFVTGGHQPVGAYDLSQVEPGQIKLHKSALWTASENLRFFSPPNPSHVSHSISNWQNNYRSDTPFIEVEANTYGDILNAHGIDEVCILKLDIEGAELEVLPEILKSSVKPKQLLIEFDEALQFSSEATRKVQSMNDVINASGFKAVHVDNTGCNVTYLASELVEGP